ncbi:hypothetical protein JMM59_13330, partial [Rhodovulum sulfidophilum]|nr:hypothetical protein [Rhodovulum sulfidophilum]
MTRRLGLLALCATVISSPAMSQTLSQANAQMLREMQSARGVSTAAIARIEAIFARSAVIGQGNPAITRHAMTREACNAHVGGNALAHYADKRFERICGARYMAPLYDPRSERPEDAKACIDQFEYPGIPCSYPVVWVKAKEAAEICAAR